MPHRKNWGNKVYSDSWLWRDLNLSWWGSMAGKVWGGQSSSVVAAGRCTNSCSYGIDQKAKSWTGSQGRLWCWILLTWQDLALLKRQTSGHIWEAVLCGLFEVWKLRVNVGRTKVDLSLWWFFFFRYFSQQQEKETNRQDFQRPIPTLPLPLARPLFLKTIPWAGDWVFKTWAHEGPFRVKP